MRLQLQKLLREQEAGGSNPLTPTTYLPPASLARHALAHVVRLRLGRSEGSAPLSRCK